MTNPDTLTAAAVAAILVGVLLAWVALDKRKRRHDHQAFLARTIEAVLTVNRSAVAMVEAGECAHLWHDSEDQEFHLCGRPYEHTGPHQCAIDEQVKR